MLFELIFFPLIKNLLTKIKNTSSAITKKQADLYSQMIEIISNIPLIKVSGTEQYEKGRFQNISGTLASLEYKRIKYLNLTPFLTETFVMLFIITLFLGGIKIFKINVLFYLPFIVAYLYVFMRLFDQINAFLDSLSGAFQSIEPFKAYEQKLNEAQKNQLSDGLLKFYSLQKEIEFRRVSFGYSLNQDVIKDANFSIPKGSFIALVGPTGGGKTTIAKLLTGLFYPSQGEILIDGINIKNLNIKSWLEKIGFISQDVLIFNDSIRNNIGYGQFRTSFSDIEKAAKVADIYDFIKGLPDGFNTILGEHGVKISGGQKQRIAIARAVLRDPSILILDEATSSLDTKTEQSIQNALEQVMTGRTVIAIAHRLSTIIKADNIIVLEKGRVTEQGSHAELIAKSNGIYKKYYELQFNR